MARLSKEKILRKSKIISIRSALAILSVAFGVLITAQFRSIPERVTNPIAPYTSLKETRESLYTEQDQLKKEISGLQKQIETIQKDSEDIVLTKTELSDLKNKKAQAGLTRLNGSGLIITLDDSKSGNINDDSIVHAADLRDIVNLLWGSGAEGISINEQRVVINTAIDCIVNTILVNDTRISAPFRIEAIGNPDLLRDRINNTNILSNIHQRKAQNGLIFDVNTNSDITLPVFNGTFEIKSTGNADV